MSFVRECVSAARRLLLQRTFSAAAIGTLALGLAAPTALFAIVNATLLHPLPYPHFREIYSVRTYMTDGRFTNGGVANQELHKLRELAGPEILSSSYVARQEDTLVTAAASRQMQAYGVYDEKFFDVFQLPMTLGRGFVKDDFRPGSPRRAVLSHRIWASMYGGDPKIVGTTIQSGTYGSVVVAGVAAENLDVPAGADIWMNLFMSENIGHAFTGYVRFRPGASPANVTAQSARVFQDLVKEFPDQEKNRAFAMRSVLDDYIGAAKPMIVMSAVATGLLWLLALVNVANLWMARGTSRGREMAVRAALGATRRDLTIQLIAESMVLALIGAIVGLALAYGGVRLVTQLGGADFPGVANMTFTPTVFAFAFVAMLVAGTLVALAPAALLGDSRLAFDMNEGGRGGGHSSTTRRFLNTMIVGEVTLAIVLVAGAGRLLLSIHNLLAVSPGFVAEGRLVADVLLPRAYYTPNGPTSLTWQDNVRRALADAGVSRVAFASSVPLGHEWDSTAFVDIFGRPTAPENRPNARTRIVSPEFFDVLGLRIVAGRGFTAEDRVGTVPAVVVSEAWARQFLPGLDPLKEKITVGGLTARRTDTGFVNDPVPIVGVVSDAKYTDVMQPDEPVTYGSFSQLPARRFSVIAVANDGHPERLVTQVRDAIGSVDPSVPVQISLMANAVSKSLVWSRLGLLLMGTFGATALALASVGVFGVIAFVVGQRRSEMAVRLALGSTRGSVFGLVMKYGARVIGGGAVFGIALAWLTGRWAQQYLFHVDAANVAVIAGSAAVVLLAAFLSVLGPARAAARVAPSQLLR